MSIYLEQTQNNMNNDKKNGRSPGRPKDRVKATLDRLEEFNASPEQLLADLDALQRDCRNGYEQQKQTARGDVVTVTEKDMKTALNCIEAKYAIVKDLLKSGQDNEAPDFKFEINVINAPKMSSTSGQESSQTEPEAPEDALEGI
jgi:hypothetical protein